MPGAALAVDPSGWLTLNEVAARLRFPSRRALLDYLRKNKNPAPVYRRVGSQRYYMRAEDIDSIMERVPVRPTPADVEASEPRFERVERVETPRRRGRSR